jgi:hypothetical protein
MKVMEMQPHNITNPDGSAGLINAMVEVDVPDPVVVVPLEDTGVPEVVAQPTVATSVAPAVTPVQPVVAA